MSVFMAFLLSHRTYMLVQGPCCWNAKGRINCMPKCCNSLMCTCDKRFASVYLMSPRR